MNVSQNLNFFNRLSKILEVWMKMFLTDWKKFSSYLLKSPHVLQAWGTNIRWTLESHCGLSVDRTGTKFLWGFLGYFASFLHWPELYHLVYNYKHRLNSQAKTFNLNRNNLQSLYLSLFQMFNLLCRNVSNRYCQLNKSIDAASKTRPFVFSLDLS